MMHTGAYRIFTMYRIFNKIRPRFLRLGPPEIACCKAAFSPMAAWQAATARTMAPGSDSGGQAGMLQNIWK